MLIDGLNYCVSEGMINIKKNKLSALMSGGIVFASLLLMNLILALSINVKYVSELLSLTPEIEVFCYSDLSDDKIETIKETIQKTEGVSALNVVSKAENFAKYKEYLGDDGGILDNYDESIMSVSFIIKPDTLDITDSLVIYFNKLEGVQSVQYPGDAVKLISRVEFWAGALNILLTVFLCGIAALVISNTVRMALTMRQREIGIMRLIGASDSYIRLPFVAESIIIALCGALAAAVVTFLIYLPVRIQVNDAFIENGLTYLRMTGVSRIMFIVIPLNIGVSTFTGWFGSFISLKKYLNI